jgi:hypothetical protein
MTGERRQIVLAAVLWAVLSLILWNVIFDYGVRTAATGYLLARTAYLHGRGPRIEMAPAMHAGIVQSLRTASLLTFPCVAVAGTLVGLALRRRRP